MDPFSYIVIGFMGGLLIVLVLIGKFYPGSGADVLDWKPTRSPEAEAENEVNDVAQMLEAQNRIRRERGLPDRTEDDVALEVAADRRDIDDRRARLEVSQQTDAERGGDEQDLDELLEARNHMRRRRGLPELTRADVEAAEAAAPTPARIVPGGNASARARSEAVRAEWLARRAAEQSRAQDRPVRPGDAGGATPPRQP